MFIRPAIRRIVSPARGDERVDLVAHREKLRRAARDGLRPRACEPDLDRADQPSRRRTQDEHAVGEVDRFVDVVGDVHDRHPSVLWLAVELQQDVLELGAGERVDRGEGLVQQEDLRARDQRACDRHPLLHPTRQLPGMPPGHVPETHLFEDGLGATDSLRPWQPAEGKHHVPDHAQPREERAAVVLEDESDLPRRARERALAQEHGALSGRAQPREHAQQRGLATAGGPDDREQLTLRYVERDVAERGRSIVRESLDQTRHPKNEAVSGPAHRPLHRARRAVAVRRRGRACSGRSRAGPGRGCLRRAPAR